jgi:hypothetical protein
MASTLIYWNLSFNLPSDMAWEAASTLTRNNVQKSHIQNIFITYTTIGAGPGSEFSYTNID